MDYDNNETLNETMVETEQPDFESSPEANEETYEEVADNDTLEEDEIESDDNQEPVKQQKQGAWQDRVNKINSKWESEIARERQEKEYLKQLVDQRLTPQPIKSQEEIAREDQRKLALQQARDLGILTQDDKEQIANDIRKEFEEKDQAREFERSTKEQVSKLNEKYTKIPGIAPTTEQEMINFATKNNIFTDNYEMIYKLMNFEKLQGALNQPISKSAPIGQPQAKSSGATPNFNDMSYDEIVQYQRAQGASI